ncbi:MAG: nitronate monooxygenase [Hyphomicrobiaceae bacterium]
MQIDTRLTRRLKIAHPILSAPMAFAAGGGLAAAVTHAGGLGFIGGGYGASDWLTEQFKAAGNAPIGCGFITWSLRKNPALLDQALAHGPTAIFLSFDDPHPFAATIKKAGALLIQQVQTRRDAEVAIDAGADIIVAQGAEAGGHGEKRATMTLVPEVADLLAARSPTTLLCAAGGIADGRGMAAALMLGADGVVVGTRFWAAREALVHSNMHAAALAASGDDTVRQSVTDIARGLQWPKRFDIRVVRNAYIQNWQGREDDLRSAGEDERARYAAAVAGGDASMAATIVGEAVGLIDSVEPASVIVERMVAEASRLLQRGTHIAN